MARQMSLRLHREPLIVDNFAGGGGASLGLEWALGRSPDIAINHDPEAIAMHAENHPSTRHLCESVWDVDPAEVCAGRPVALAWFSPDCTHFSKAKGGKPVKKEIRGLADVVHEWIRAVRPRVIMLENVEEFETWGPLHDTHSHGCTAGEDEPCRRGCWFNTPIKERVGESFEIWRDKIVAAGYEIQFFVLRGCDYGAATLRKRLFAVARCDGLPIVMPSPTFGPTTDQPWRVAAECIDFSIPAPSIFLTAREARELGLDVRRPLADKTLARIARGVFRYAINEADPFIVPVTHGGDHRVHDIREPVRTITSAHRGEFSLVAPTLINTGYGERPGQAPRVPGLHKPVGTIVGCGGRHALVSAYLAKHNGGNEATGQHLTESMHTITARDAKALVTSHMVKYYGTSTGTDLRTPAPTIPAQGWKLAEVRALLRRFSGHASNANERALLGLVGPIDGEVYQIADIGMRMLVARELFRAQGFPDSYRIDVSYKGGRLTATAQLRMVGNSVCPQLAYALARANVADLGLMREVA